MTSEERIYSIKSSRGQNIKHYKPENISKELAVAAVSCDGLLIRYIPKDICDEEIYLAACSQNGGALFDVPEEKKTPELCLIAVKRDGYSFSFVPESLRTAEMSLIACRSCHQMLKIVPPEIITPELVSELYKEELHFRKIAEEDGCEPESPEVLPSLPNTVKKTEFFIKVIEICPEIFWEIPKKNRTVKACASFTKASGCTDFVETVRKYPYILSYASEAMINHDVAMTFMESDFFEHAVTNEDTVSSEKYPWPSLETYSSPGYEDCFWHVENGKGGYFHIPALLKWKDTAEKAIQININFLKFIPDEFISEKMCMECLHKCPYILKDIPDKYKTKQVCDLAFKNYKENIKDIPEVFIDQEMCIAAVKESSYLLKYIPEKYKTKELYLLALQHSYGAFNSIPASLRDSDIYHTAFMNACSGLPLLCDIPEYYIDQELCRAAIKINLDNFQYVPINCTPCQGHFELV